MSEFGNGAMSALSPLFGWKRKSIGGRDAAWTGAAAAGLVGLL
jgi:hypothetical protein